MKRPRSAATFWLGLCCAANHQTGQRFLERSRGRKDAYLSDRIRTLDADDRAVLARAATLLEKLLEGEGQ